MRKRIALSASAVFALLAVPAAAADATAPTTPQDDIECAAWASYTGSFAEDDAVNDSLAMRSAIFSDAIRPWQGRISVTR